MVIYRHHERGRIRTRIALHPVFLLCLLGSRLLASRASYSSSNQNYQQQQWSSYKNTYNQNYFQASDSSSYKSSGSSSGRSSSSGNNFYNGPQEFTVCGDSVVRVRALYAVCDSPYTFYYGNGANRNSPVCSYGDKLSMEVRFQVTDDINDSDTIYVTLAVYDDLGNMLISVDPVYLCDDLVGYDCTTQGYYGFIYRLRLPYPYSNDYSNSQSSSSSSSSSSGSSSSSVSQFLPNIQMAFSTQPDSGYNLGAMNVDCEPWDPNDPSYVSWSHSRSKRSPLNVFSIEYGILFASCAALLSVVAFVWRQAAFVEQQQVQNALEALDSVAEFEEFEAKQSSTRACLMD